MKSGKILSVLALSALFLLLLSALVVSPATADSGAECADLTGMRLLPLALPAQGLNDFDLQRFAPLRVFALAVLFFAPALPLLKKERDANGRVLQAVRYENSFYQVFHQEVAGG